jgi:hypothetical protein
MDMNNNCIQSQFLKHTFLLLYFLWCEKLIECLFPQQQLQQHQKLECAPSQQRVLSSWIHVSCFFHTFKPCKATRPEAFHDWREREIAKASYIKDVLPMSFNVWQHTSIDSCCTIYKSSTRWSCLKNLYRPKNHTQKNSSVRRNEAKKKSLWFLPKILAVMCTRRTITLPDREREKKLFSEMDSSLQNPVAQCC